MNESTNKIIPFGYGDNLVRIVEDENGTPWWVAKDVATILEYSDSQAMTRRLDKDEINSYTDNSSGQGRNIIIINESGLYTSILGSKKPEAKKFKKWVTSEVLPSIRKTGSYGVKNQGVSEHILAQIVESNREITLTLLQMNKILVNMHNDIKTILANQNKPITHIEYRTYSNVGMEREIMKRLDINLHEFSVLNILFTRKDYLEWKIIEGEKFYKLLSYKILELFPQKVSKNTITRTLKKLRDKKLIYTKNRRDGNYMKINENIVDILGGLL